MQAPSENKWFT